MIVFEYCIMIHFFQLTCFVFHALSNTICITINNILQTMPKEPTISTKNSKEGYKKLHGSTKTGTCLTTTIFTCDPLENSSPTLNEGACSLPKTILRVLRHKHGKIEYVMWIHFVSGHLNRLAPMDWVRVLNILCNFYRHMRCILLCSLSFFPLI